MKVARLSLMVSTLLVHFVFVFSFNSFSQFNDYVLKDTAEITPAKFNYLKENFSKNKRIPAGYEKIVLYTLSFFPELKDYKIEFEVRPKGAPLSSRPAWGSMFSNARKRTYLVFIHSGPDTSFFSSLFNKAPMPGQIGILGHELSHVVNFTKMSSFDLLSVGVNHISKGYMDKFEFYTDSLCIEHGLGYYLKYWAGMFDQMFSSDSVPEFNKSKTTPTGERYMSAKTIQAYIDKSPMYKKKDTVVIN